MKICLCGSLQKNTKMTFLIKEAEFTKQGHIVFLPIMNNDNIDKYTLMKVQFEKIKISDMVYIMNKDGYIGKSTFEEIKFAYILNKMVVFEHPIEKIKDDEIRKAILKLQKLRLNAIYGTDSFCEMYPGLSQKKNAHTEMLCKEFVELSNSVKGGVIKQE